MWQGVPTDSLEASVRRGLLGARSRKSERAREFGEVHAILLGDGTAEGTLVVAGPLRPPPQWAGRRECDQALGCSRGPGYFGPLISARKVSYTHPHSPPQSLGHAPPLPHTPTQTQKSCRIVSGKTWADLVPSPGCVPEQESYLLKFSLLICKIKRYLI